jgi:chromosome segregation ATPase
VPTPARQLWRRAKLQVADDVRTRFEADLSELRERLGGLERRLDGLEELMSSVKDTLESLVDMENESDELIGRLLGRLTGRIEQLELR